MAISITRSLWCYCVAFFYFPGFLLPGHKHAAPLQWWMPADNTLGIQWLKKNLNFYVHLQFIDTSDVTQRQSCIVGDVGDRFWKGRGMQVNFDYLFLNCPTWVQQWYKSAMLDQQTAFASVSLCLLVALRSGFLGQTGILTVVLFFFFFFVLAIASPLAVAMLPTVISRGKLGGGDFEMLSVSALNAFQTVQSN